MKLRQPDLLYLKKVNYSLAQLFIKPNQRFSKCDCNKAENHAYVNQKANIADYFDYFFLLVHTYSSEITSKEQSDLDIGMGGIFLKA